jgi:hypothetical protein
MPRLYLTRDKDPFDPNLPFGGVHITILGWNHTINLPEVNPLGRYECWVPHSGTIFDLEYLPNGIWAICFRSDTLDRVCLSFTDRGYKNAKGSSVSPNHWRIIIPNCYSRADALAYLFQLEKEKRIKYDDPSKPRWRLTIAHEDRWIR